jgi:NADH-quinone oxidoreductase subunit H
MRAVAVLVSYEVPLVLSVVGVLLLAGSMSLVGVVEAQVLPFFLLQPVGFFIFLVASIAEMNRPPFDLMEAESELVAGYHTEYSGMKFGLFFLTDFVETVLVAALTTVLFFGGWQVPWVDPRAFSPNVMALLGVGAFTVKVACFLWLFMAIRWTLPRFRYDQLMRLGWKVLFPLSIANIGITGVARLLVK